MCSRVLIQLDTHWIVDVLMEDAVLVQRRERLHGALGLPPADLPDLTRSININLTETHGFFTSVINRWISSKGVAATLEALVHVLKEERFQATADLLQCKAINYAELPHQIRNGSTQNERSVFFDMPESILHFTGRVHELEKLHNTIISRNEGDITVITTLSGLGGIGKTTLSIHYARNYSLKFYSSVIWINSESKVTIHDSFTRLAEQLKIDTVGRNGDKIDVQILAKSIYQYCGAEKTLLILDNAENYESIVNYLPVSVPGQNTPFVLLTSRRKVWNDKVSVIELDVFSEEESLDFFKIYLNLKRDDEMKLAIKISQLLHNLPLAIVQAGAYIRIQSQTTNHSKSIYLEDYISKFESNCRTLLGFEYYRQTRDKYERTTLMTWSITMKKIKEENPISVTIMKCSSYLNPDNIPTKLFKYYYSTGKKFEQISIRIKYKIQPWESMLLSAINLLSDYSMIATNTVKDTFSVHRLVQRVMRLKLESNNSYSNLEQIFKLIKISLSADRFDEFETICVVHAESVLEYMKAYKAGYKKYGKQLQSLIISKQSNVINYQISLVESSFKLNQWEEGGALNKEFLLQWYNKSKENLQTYVYSYAKMMGLLFLYFSHKNCNSLLPLLKEFYVYAKEYYIQFPRIFVNFDFVQATSLISEIKNEVQLKHRLIVEMLTILRLHSRNEEGSLLMRDSVVIETSVFTYVDSVFHCIASAQNILQDQRYLFATYSSRHAGHRFGVLAYEVEVLFPLITILMSEPKDVSKNWLSEALFMLDRMYECYRLRIQNAVDKLKHSLSSMEWQKKITYEINAAIYWLQKTITMSIECCMKLKSEQILFQRLTNFKEFVYNLPSFVYEVFALKNFVPILKELFTSRHYLFKGNFMKENIVDEMMSLCKMLRGYSNSHSSVKSIFMEVQRDLELLKK